MVDPTNKPKIRFIAVYKNAILTKQRSFKKKSEVPTKIIAGGSYLDLVSITETIETILFIDPKWKN